MDMVCMENECGREGQRSDVSAAAVARRANARPEAKGKARAAEEARGGCAAPASALVVAEASCPRGDPCRARGRKLAARARVSRRARGDDRGGAEAELSHRAPELAEDAHPLAR